MKRYDIHKEGSRPLFRKAVKKDKDSCAEIRIWLIDMLYKWTRADKDTRRKKEVCVVIIMEELTECMPTGLRICVKERKL